MEEITRFVLLARSDRFTITDLCEQYSAFAEGKTLIGISRKTGHKHLERFAAEGMRGLQPRSHRAHTFPQRTAATVEALVLEAEKMTCGRQAARDAPTCRPHVIFLPPAADSKVQNVPLFVA